MRWQSQLWIAGQVRRALKKTQKEESKHSEKCEFAATPQQGFPLTHSPWLVFLCDLVLKLMRLLRFFWQGNFKVRFLLRDGAGDEQICRCGELGFGAEGWHPAGSLFWPWLHYPPLDLLGEWGWLRIFTMQKGQDRYKEPWGVILHPKEILGALRMQKYSHSTTPIEMKMSLKRIGKKQPEGWSLSPGGFPPHPQWLSEEMGSGLLALPPGECPQCCRRITHLPFTRGYLGLLPLSTEQLVGSHPKAIGCGFKYTLYADEL